MDFFMNIYASGHYHRKGKPGVTDYHGGDLYATEAQARYDAEPEKGYVFTVKLYIPAAAAKALNIRANGPESVPVPLSLTRSKRAVERQRALEDFYKVPVTAASYKPAHGGYPSARPTPGTGYL
jgi:hypothetical protein